MDSIKQASGLISADANAGERRTPTPQEEGATPGIDLPRGGCYAPSPSRQGFLSKALFAFVNKLAEICKKPKAKHVKNDVLTADQFAKTVRYLQEQRVAPCDNGVYICSAPKNLEAHFKSIAPANVLVNPTRQELIARTPRTVYQSDHLFDEVDDEGSVAILSDDLFWKKHEKAYQKWLENPQ